MKNRILPRLRISLLICSILLAFFFLFPFPMTVSVDGTNLSAGAVLYHGTTMAPAKPLLLSMGAEIKESSPNTVTAYRNGTSVTFTAGDHMMTVNGKSQRLSVAPFVHKGELFIPVSATATAFDMDVSHRLGRIAITSLPESEELFTMNGVTFTNHLDGYSITLPDGFSVDLSMPAIRTRMESEHTILDIYRQENETLGDADMYTTYSGEAITKSQNVTVTRHEDLTLAGKPATILCWSRPSLSRVENDKPYYCKIDFPDGTVTHTFLFKSSEPLEDFPLSVADSFTRVPVTYSAAKAEEQMPVFHGGENQLNAEASAYLENTFGENASLTWGLYEPSYHSDINTISWVEDAIEHRFDILLSYSDFYKTYDPALVRGFLDEAWAEGRVTELTLQPVVKEGGKHTLFAVLDGDYDEFLTAYAQSVADFDHPVLLRLLNEMNGDWCEYSAFQMSLDADLYVELYRYVAHFFEDAGADNVIYIFNPNGKSFPDFKWNDQRLYYPGDEYADIWGLTAYNTGDYYVGESWQSFDALYQPLYDRSSELTDMPFMITEFACARKGGDKEAWVKDMLQRINDYPNIKVAVWWNFADYDGEMFVPENLARAYYYLDSDELVTIWKDYFAQ